MDEQEKIRLEKQLDDPRKDSKKDSKISKRNLPVTTKMCCHFAAGKCTRGAACPYKHVTLKKSRVATVNAYVCLYMFVVSGNLYRPLLSSQSWKLGGKILGGFGTQPPTFLGAGLSILVFF